MSGPVAPPSVSEAELHAFVDGALDAGRQAQVASKLGDDAALAARVAAYAADRDRLRAAFGRVRPVPPDWARRIEAATARPTPRMLTRRTALAASLALAAGGAVVATKALLGGDTIVAAAQHARASEAAGRPLSAAMLEDAGARDGALRAALGISVRAPDLHRFGFRLTRLEILGHAAQLRYGDARARLLTIYVRPSDGSVRFDLLRDGADRVCVWQDDVVGAVIIAPMPAGEMLRVAAAAYGALNL